MIIARIRGGFGNQLFIYAAARRLALFNDVPLVLDIQSAFRRNEQDHCEREYILDQFNILAEPADANYIFSSRPRRLKYNLMSNTQRWLIPFRHRRIIQEPVGHFDNRILNLEVGKKNVYLEGYWQDERYFRDIRTQLITELSIRTEHTELNRQIVKDMGKHTAVCLHARRLHGGVPDHGKPRDDVPALGIGYYHRAMDWIAERVDEPHFYCFSDFPQFLKSELKPRYPVTFITHNNQPGRVIEDLWLMTQCKHFIIANSTFSWWGAWLSDDSTKMVVSPDWPQRTQIPEDWIMLPS